MNSIELLKKYPLSAEIVRDWFMEKMIKSIQGDTTVPEDFKNFILEQKVDNNKLSLFIDSNPRNLFDLFDNNNIIIEIFLYPNDEFTCKIGNQATINSWKQRKDCELFVIEAAFEILEEQLKTLENE
jgi:hypothetical protein